ncbi:hybrid sensor histidine kinase/response regulator [Asticcacaulis benevestitus]|uniref:histidine kinase n=1 Tax=Asticcacaulis benevestitus DSM 16100 = ATCC BAA-896 TaxID=1121022 RepID=V4P3F9_9CAUL|nr:hybrid sensor histidine kinase/response regulator [Asticcacaulis benevestitus]ESQ88517.1 hypothetical protein ABENE_15845 [Asticcacaulis benevestitus DSM 16100 = ATCC BAA-896]
MNSPQRTPTEPASPLPRHVSRDSVVLDYGLLAQWRLSPYALGFFGIGLPLFIWAAALAVSGWLLAIYLMVFLINWTVFMIMKNQSAKRMTATPTPDPALRYTLIRERRLRQGAAGALWTLTLLMISLSVSLSGQGQHNEFMLMICGGAAVGVIFFCAPVLLFLLILGPIAVAGPIFAMYHLHPGGELSQFMTGGMALTLAMGFVLNRHMQEHYLLQHGQLEAASERESARAEAHALNDAKMALMETLSREVQTGLTGIEQNLLQGLTHLSRAPAPRQYVDAALNEVGHLQSILVTTLDNDTAAAGQIEIDVRPLDIDLLAQRMIGQFAPLAHSKGLSLSYNTSSLPEGTLPGLKGAALGDEHRVEQILAHLLSNALLYTQQGRVELKLLLLPEGFLRLEVVDSGPGLSPGELEQAFTPHARILRTSSGQSGAGLGLSLSRSLSALMGGRTGAESTLDVGSKFWLDLPYDSGAVPPPRPVDSDDAPRAAHDHSLRVLLISNDSLRSALLRDSLEHLGHKCLTSTSRERALTLAKKAPIDACLISTGTLDVLEDADHRGTLERFLNSLRQTQEDARLTIVALLPDGQQAEALHDLGVTSLLMPLNREALSRALAQAPSLA